MGPLSHVEVESSASSDKSIFTGFLFSPLNFRKHLKFSNEEGEERVGWHEQPELGCGSSALTELLRQSNTRQPRTNSGPTSLLCFMQLYDVLVRPTVS